MIARLDIVIAIVSEHRRLIMSASSTSTPTLVAAVAIGAVAGFGLSQYLKSSNTDDSFVTEDELNCGKVAFRYVPPPVNPAPTPIPSSDPILEKDAVQKTVYGAPLPGSETIQFDVLQDFMRDTFTSYGTTAQDADIASDVLIASDKRGIDSHGVGRLRSIYCERMDAGILNAQSKLRIINQTKTTATVDGGNGIGLAIGPKCMQLAIKKAKKHGIGMVCVRNSTHFGFAGYYPLMAAEAGCVGIAGTNARPSVAPTYGTEPMFGTNPIVFGMPSTDKFPFVIDCATSVNQRGKIEKYVREGKPTPAGAVISNDGEELTDSTQILHALIDRTAACTTLGGAGHKLAGYKGYGYATTVEILCSALCENGFGEALADKYIDDDGKRARRPSLLGHFFLAIDITAFTSVEKFKTTTGAILRGLRESKKDPKGPGRIYTAGEPEWVAWSHRSNYGGTTISPALIKDMKELREGFSPALKKKYEAVLPF